MSILFALVLMILTFFLGHLFWQLIKAKRLMKRMLKEPKSLSMFVSNLKKTGYYSKKAVEASETGGMWSNLLSKGAGYDVLIGFEEKSSAGSFSGPRNIIFVLILIIFALGLLCLPYSLIVLPVFILTYFIPLSESGMTRVNQELTAMSWLLYQFNKANPTGCNKFIEHAIHLKLFHGAIAQLD